ncbi:MAG: hypothetical protein JO072_00490 [Parafilimonas sp.]|nr:hypothetical protein [Parafilimonas sp.]
MELYYTLFYITSAVIGSVLILKTYLFFSKSHFHQYTDWLHFSKYNIYTSQSNKIVKAKQTQNILSNLLLIFIILDAGFFFMAHLVQL